METAKAILPRLLLLSADAVRPHLPNHAAVAWHESKKQRLPVSRAGNM